ncbi:MAG TPA: GGDEF domain-containing protein [Candidatus Binatia bacterium]|nr:GGDEF domain-containing protein [Candidatus Binatia bacterium]
MVPVKLKQPGRQTLIVCAAVGVYLGVSLLAPRGIGLTTFGDLAQCILLLAATVAVLCNISTTCKKAQLFWILTAVGCGMWLCAQVLWTYFEVFLRQDAPNPFVADVVLFLHVVPIMAALIVQPHIQRSDSSLRLVSLDFSLLLGWWLYLYLFAVIPWQYVSPDEAAYGRSFDLLYACEQLVLITGLLLICKRSAGYWRGIYRQILKAAAFYAAGSTLAGVAIDSHRYYTGSIYDIPLIAAMAGFAGLGIVANQTSDAQPAAQPPFSHYSMWTARLAMMAVFSTPLMIAWAEFGGDAPGRVRIYRLWLTVAAMLFMGALVYLKQHSMDRELLHLLQLSRQNLDEMCKLKDELENKEHSLRWHSLELQRKNLELQEISFTDALTGVWNRRYLEEILTAEAGQVLRNYERARGGDIRKLDHRDLVFIMVDVDFFKQVNDVHGHPAGDRLLQRVAERLTRVVRKSDVLVRWGGEEFLIMSRSADPAGTPAFCERILQVISSEDFDLGHGARVRKTCSVGWAPFPWSRSAYEALCAEEVIELADAALYRAKAAGRNQGIGILPMENAISGAQQISLRALQNDRGTLTRMVSVLNPEPSVAPEISALIKQPHET